jgi:hypothetical protein
MVELLRQVNEKKVSAAEARLKMGLARVILETLKVEIAAAHLAASRIPPVSLAAGGRALPLMKVVSGDTAFSRKPGKKAG